MPRNHGPPPSSYSPPLTSYCSNLPPSQPPSPSIEARPRLPTDSIYRQATVVSRHWPGARPWSTYLLGLPTYRPEAPLAYLLAWLTYLSA